jgi:hypothetical protein
MSLGGGAVAPDGTGYLDGIIRQISNVRGTSLIWTGSLTVSIRNVHDV